MPWPALLDLRASIETHILDLYQSNGTLKAYTDWPGYYTLPDATRRPAVYVVGAQQVPSNWRITGIECTIDDVPEDVESPGSVNGVISFERWLVRFTNYGTQAGTTMPVSMLDIRRRLARAFPRDRTSYQHRTEATFEALTAYILSAALNPPIPL